MTDSTGFPEDGRRERKEGPGGRDARVESLLLDLLGTPEAPVIAVMEVHGQTAGEVEVRPLGARDMDPFTALALSGVEATFGDLALCVRAANVWYVVNVVGVSDIKIARADHQHASAGELSVGLGTGATASGLHAVAIGESALASGDDATGIGERATAISYGAAAVGAYAEAAAADATAVGNFAYAGATAVGATAVGAYAYATATRSIAIGKSASSPVADEAVMRANRLVVKRSDGTVGYTRIDLQDGAGTRRALTVDADDSFSVNSRRYGTYPGYFPTNKTVASGGPYNFRSAPVVSTTNIVGAIPSGTAIHDSGFRFDEGGYNWAYVFWHARGFGYMLSSAIV